MIRSSLIILILSCVPMVSGAQITIADYRSEVLDYSRSLRASEAQLSASKAEVRRAKSAMLPSLSVDANFDVAFGDMGDERRWSWGVRPQLSQTIYGGGSARAEYNQARIAHDMAVASYDSSMLDAVYAADNAYWTLSRAEIYCRAIEDYLSIIVSLKEVVAERYNEGYISKSDLLQVESRMSDAEYQLSSARQSYIIARHDFNSLRGVVPDADVTLAESILDTLSMPYRCSESDLLVGHPLYDEALAAAESASWDIRRVNARYMPNLSVGVFGSWQPSMPNVAGAGTMLDGGAFVGLSVPIYRFGERRHAVQRARSNYEGS